MHSLFPIGQSLNGSQGVFLVLAVGLALAFECVNGFHDTANAVATVIYTHTLRPWIAVVWSGIWNLIGVLFSSGAVAFGIVALLPVELVINVGTGAGFAMVFALLVSAIIWNLGTWYLGLPASSSHTLIGSIMGVGLANSLMSPGHVFGEGVNWAKAGEVGMSLLISPIVGFVCSALLLLLAKALIRNPALYESPKGTEPPPVWIRGLLMLTCTGVSFAHGSNDGQKGMGLIMLILVGILPGAYALKMTADAPAIQLVAAAAHAVQPGFERLAGGATVSADEAKAELSAYLKTDGKASAKTYAAVAAESVEIVTQLDGKTSFGDVPAEERKALRSNIYLAGTSIAKLAKQGKFTDPKDKASFTAYGHQLDLLTKFIPDWVKVAVALSLGLGTMVGWKRIVVTVGEKIGKSHLTYGQGACAELVAMCTILAADNFGLPVSTTHVLSSGVAGTMAANRSGLQGDTLRNILLAWVLTLPVCVLLGAGLFSFGLFIVFNVLRMH
jgi:PiT family inorganic phosphate transporter